jgi:hypothetical protein
MQGCARTRLAIAITLLAPALAGAEFEPVRPYQEVADPPTPVRGHAVVGVSVVAKGPDMQSDVLWVHLGKAEKGLHIRADLASANGRLRGEGTWQFNPREKSPGGPWYKLAAPPKAQRPERSEHFSVAVQPEPINPAMPAFVLTALGPGAPKETSPLVRLYVNTRRAEMFVYPPGAKEGRRCAGVEGTQVVRFDAVCEFQLEVGDRPGPATVTLVRRDGHQTSQQKIEIRW